MATFGMLLDGMDDETREDRILKSKIGERKIHREREGKRERRRERNERERMIMKKGEKRYRMKKDPINPEKDEKSKRRHGSYSFASTLYVFKKKENFRKAIVLCQFSLDLHHYKHILI